MQHRVETAEDFQSGARTQELISHFQTRFESRRLAKQNRESGIDGLPRYPEN
jgi:hypothetical protein